MNTSLPTQPDINNEEQEGTSMQSSIKSFFHPVIDVDVEQNRMSEETEMEIPITANKLMTSPTLHAASQTRLPLHTEEIEKNRSKGNLKTTGLNLDDENQTDTGEVSYYLRKRKHSSQVNIPVVSIDGEEERVVPIDGAEERVVPKILKQTLGELDEFFLFL